MLTRDAFQSIYDQGPDAVYTLFTALEQRIVELEARLNKDSHNSHLPPSSDRFHRQPKSLRKSSGKKPGGQTGHPGSTLLLSPTPDQVLVHVVDWCQHCQRDLREVESLTIERRQVLDLPPKRVVVIEHQAQQKWCPACHEISIAAFPDEVRAPVQYGAAFGAVGVYLVQQRWAEAEQVAWMNLWAGVDALLARTRPGK